MRSTRASDRLIRARSLRPGLPFLAALFVVAVACGGERAERAQLVAFGTLVTVTAWDVAPGRFADAVAALESRYRELEVDWYPWADGELARINAALARGDDVPVSPALAALIRRAAVLETQSEGFFNPALGRLTELWGFNEPDRAGWRPPPETAIAELVAADPSAADLDWNGNRLSSRSRAVALDPGGIAKGALLEVSARILAERDIGNAIVDLGGDLAVLGSPPGRAAQIGIRRPGGDGAIARLAVAGGESVMTSGNYERYFEHGGRRYAHVLDPRTGRPAAGTASVTVVAADPLLADAAATALLAAGAPGFERLSASLGVDFALLVTDSGDVRLTPGMARRVHWLAN